MIKINSISVSDLLKLNSPKIIDIRSSYNYSNGHIPGAININGYYLLDHSERYLNKREVYYIYCQSGSRSKVIVNELIKMGYNAVNVSGGYNSYLFRN